MLEITEHNDSEWAIEGSPIDAFETLAEFHSDGGTMQDKIDWLKRNEGTNALLINAAEDMVRNSLDKGLFKEETGRVKTGLLIHNEIMRRLIGEIQTGAEKGNFDPSEGLDLVRVVSYLNADDFKNIGKG